MRAVEKVGVVGFLAAVVAPVAVAVVAVHVGTAAASLRGDAAAGAVEGVLLVLGAVPVLGPHAEEPAAVGVLLAGGAGVRRPVAVVAPGLLAARADHLVNSR